MFPKVLDGAGVLYYTLCDDFEFEHVLWIKRERGKA